jgi:hypothetical protein
VEEATPRIYHQGMGQHYGSELRNESELGSEQHQVHSFRFYAVTVSLPLMFTLGAIPFRWPAGLAGFYAVILRLFQNSNRAGTWLVFGLVWMVCATAAVTSAYFVLCVAEMRKRILARQFARQVSASRGRRV